MMWDTLLRPKINSPAEIVTKYISIKIYFSHVTGQQFPIAVTMRHDTGPDNLHHNEMFHEMLLHTQNHGNSDFLLLSSDQCSILLVVIGNVTGVEMIQCYPMSLSDVWTRGLTMGQC